MTVTLKHHVKDVMRIAETGNTMRDLASTTGSLNMAERKILKYNLVTDMSHHMSRKVPSMDKYRNSRMRAHIFAKSVLQF